MISGEEAPAKTGGFNKTYKSLMLVSIILVHFFTKIATQYPKAFGEEIKESFGMTKKNDAEFQQINSCFQAAQVVMAIFAYGFVQRFGFEFCLPTFTAIAALGGIVTAFGFANANRDFWWIVSLGRFILGCGVAPIKVCYQAMIKKWISDRNLSVALAAILLATGLGLISTSFIANLCEAFQWDKHSKVRNFGFMVAVAQVVSFFLSFAIVFCEKKLTERNTPSQEQFEYDAEKAKRNWAWDILVNTWRAIRDSKFFFWLLVLQLVFLNVALKPFNNFVQQAVNKRFNDKSLGRYAMLLNGGSLLLTPLFGMVVDRLKHRSFVSLLASVVIVGANVLFYAVPDLPQAAFWVVLAIDYMSFGVMATAFWPTIPFAGHEKKRIGSAFGIINSIDAMSTAILSTVLKMLPVEKEAMFIGPMASALIGLVVAMMDWRRGMPLDGSVSDDKPGMEALESQSEIESDVWTRISGESDVKRQHYKYGDWALQRLNDPKVMSSSERSSLGERASIAMLRSVSEENSRPEM